MLTLAFAQNAQAQAAASTGPSSSSLIGLMPIAVIFVIFYFLLIKPQKKQQKEHAKMIDELQKNDEVVTTGGILGTIVNIQDNVVTLRIDDNVRIKIQRSYIGSLKKVKTEVVK